MEEGREGGMEGGRGTKDVQVEREMHGALEEECIQTYVHAEAGRKIHPASQEAPTSAVA